MATSFFKQLLLVSLVLLTACKDEVFNEAEQFEKDVAIIRSYIEEHNIEAEEIGSSGVYIQHRYINYDHTYHLNYSIYDDSISYVDIAYKGYLTDGSIFDQTETDSTVLFALEGLIIGWQIGIPEMTIGDSATLFIPSYFGYGPYSKKNIPSNSVLLFDIYLKSFYNKLY